jgi:hypothetical protein
MPAKLDVHKMHAETTGYLERAVKILASEAPVPAATPTTTPRPGAKKE